MLSEEQMSEVLSSSVRKLVSMSDNIRGRFCVSNDSDQYFISKKIVLDMDAVNCNSSISSQIKSDLNNIRTELLKTYPNICFGYSVVNNGSGYDIGCSIRR